MRMGWYKTEEHKRKISESRKGFIMSKEQKDKLSIVMSGKISGEKHWNWKQGRSGLIRRLRASRKIVAWREFIYERDNYQCVNCNCSDKGLLEAHHIEEFSKILTDFLDKYSELSPLKDISVLYALAMKHEPFWDVNNGITVCVSCHKKIVHTWGKYKMKEGKQYELFKST